MFTRFKERRRNDYVVVERKGQLVPVKRKEHYRPKPQQALAVIPQVTVLPPVRREMKTFATVKVVTRRNTWGDQVTAVDAWVERPSPATSYLMAAVFNFLTACKLRD